MKTILKVVLILLLGSCTSTKVIELGGRAASEGVKVSQKAIDVFSLLAKQADIDKSQQDKIKVLTNPDPSTMSLPETKVQDFSQQLAPRILAYKSLLNTYSIFAVLTDKNYGDKTKDAMKALEESYNSINKLPDLPSTVSSKLPEVSKMITQAFQAKNIKQHNQILYSLTQLYFTLWNADEKIWDDYIDRIYNDYIMGLTSIESKQFDVKKIEQTFKEPYKDESTIILMYRLQCRDEIVKQRDEVKKQLKDFGKALLELTQAHAEIGKAETNISDVTSSLNSIENLLNQK